MISFGSSNRYTTRYRAQQKRAARIYPYVPQKKANAAADMNDALR